ncbi:Alpha/Beta hydrolase protein [Aspergillus stella-maris]|uniref:Alpha/Beta hydrolase protein n=1 Tax=Aspergillus stella-maris TaxID=1810926 RepID=UPI003CCCDC02
MPLRYDPEFAAAAGPTVSAMAAALKTLRHDISALRSAIDAMIAPVLSLPPVPGIEVTEHEVPSKDGHRIPIYHIALKDQNYDCPRPAVLYIHGGGFIHGNATHWTNVRAKQVQKTGIPIFTVNYRLAPEYPFPTPVEDVYTALKWIGQHAETFGIDNARICIMGESAGGGLAAGVALMARDRGLSPPLAKHIILCPMLDDRPVLPDEELEGFVTWNTENNVTGWAAYLGHRKLENDGANGDVGADMNVISPYAAPARETDLRGLPPLYMDVGGLDIIRDECIAYAGRAAAANVEVELHVYPGVTHGFEALAVGTGVVDRALANRHAAMRTF